MAVSREPPLPSSRVWGAWHQPGYQCSEKRGLSCDPPLPSSRVWGAWQCHAIPPCHRQGCGERGISRGSASPPCHRQGCGELARTCPNFPYFPHPWPGSRVDRAMVRSGLGGGRRPVRGLMARLWYGTQLLACRARDLVGQTQLCDVSCQNVWSQSSDPHCLSDVWVGTSGSTAQGCMCRGSVGTFIFV